MQNDEGRLGMSVGNKKLILLVEDEPIIALAERMSLEAYGYRVAVASTGEQAVEMMKAETGVDMILMDIDLGAGIDGTEAARIILQENELPVVFLSSHTETAVVEKTEKITSYGYVVKNSGITVLDASIKMAFKLFAANRKIRDDSSLLNERERLLENILEHFPGRVFWKDKDLVYQGCNKNEASRLGFASPDEIVGKTDFDMPWTPDEAEIYRKADKDIMERGEPILHREQSRYAADGRLVWEDRNKVPLYDASGAIAGIFGVALDITARKSMEDALRESQRKNRFIMDMAPFGIFQMEENGDSIALNAMEYRQFECRSAEEYRAYYGDISRRWADPEKLAEFRKDLLESRVVRNREVRARLRDGRIKWFLLSAAYDGSTSTVLGVSLDITSTK
jgi:PAS domain S-box-containing protein